jgi:hypothetical protein
MPKSPASPAAARSERGLDGVVARGDRRDATVRLALIVCALAAPTTFVVTAAAHLALGAWGGSETTGKRLWIVFALGLVANIAATAAAHGLGVRAQRQGAGGPALLWALRATPWLAVVGFLAALVLPLLSVLNPAH